MNSPQLKASDTYAGDLIVQRSLDLLKVEFPILTRIVADFSAEPALFGQTLRTRIVTPPASVDYHTSNGYVAQTTTTTDVAVTLDNHRAVPIRFHANQLGATNRDLFGEQAPAMNYSLGADLVNALYSLITAGNFTEAPTVQAELDFDRATIIALGAALTSRGVPNQGRTLLLNTEYYARLMQDEVVANLGAYQRAEIITGSRLPMLHGFEIIEAPNLPATGNLAGFAFHRNALILATRLPNDANKAFPGVTGGSTRVITNPDTGLSVLLLQDVNLRLGDAFAALAIMYGTAVGQAASGQLLLSANP